MGMMIKVLHYSLVLKFRFIGETQTRHNFNVRGDLLIVRRKYIATFDIANIYYYYYSKLKRRSREDTKTFLTLFKYIYPNQTNQKKFRTKNFSCIRCFRKYKKRIY